MNTSSSLPNPNPIDFSVNEYTDHPQIFLNGSPFANLPDVDNTFFSRLHELARYHLDSGNYTQGLSNLDKCLDYLVTNLEGGSRSPLLKDYVLETVKFLNEEALRLLKNDKPLEALRILEKCKELTHPDKYGIFPKQRSLTFNHVGCCYRRLGNLEKALYHLEKALQFVQGDDRIDVSGITHINLCAVLSQMQNHKKALEQAKLAVSECAYDLINANNEKELDKVSITKKRATMLAIAYHNLGIEESYCNDDEAAMQAYFKAYKLAEEHNGVDDKLYQKFKQAHDDTVERIIKNNRKSVPGRKKGVSLSKKGKSRLSPKNLYFKKTSLYNTNALAAKVYLQNGRVVIPNFKDYKEPKEPKAHKSQKSLKSNRPLSGALSSGNFQKVPKAVAATEKKPRRQRPFTANARNEHSSLDRREVKNVDTSDSNSELEKFVFEDEEELEWINMKSNRLNFLSHLNQFQTHKSVVEERKSEKGISIPSKNQSDFYYHNSSARDDNPVERQTPKNKRMLIDTSTMHRKSSIKNEPSSTKNTGFSQISEKAEEGSSGQTIKSSLKSSTPLALKGTQKEAPQSTTSKAYRANRAVITIQKRWRGYRVRKFFKNKFRNNIYVTCLSRNIDKPLEKKHVKIGTSIYYVLMMYNFADEYILIQIKNLRTKKFYKTIVPHKAKESYKNKKRAGFDLKVECENLLQRLSILDGCIVISQTPLKQGDSHRPLVIERSDFKKDSSHGKLGSFVNYTDTITSQLSQPESEESDLMPLLSKGQLGQQSTDKKSKIKSNSFRDSFAKKIAMVDSVNIPTKDSQGSPKASILKSPSQRRQVVRPFSGVQKLVSSEIDYRKPRAPSDVEDEPIEPLMKPKHKSVKIETNLSIPEKALTKKDQNENVVFAQSTLFKDHMLEFKLSGKFEKGSRSQNNLFLSCNDLSEARTFNDLAIPQNLLHFKEITVEDLLDLININFKIGKMSLKGDKNDAIIEDEDELGDIKPMFPSRMKDSLNDREDGPEESDFDTKEDIRKIKNKMNSMSHRGERKEVQKPERGITTQSDDELLTGIGPLINKGIKSPSATFEGPEYVVPVHFPGYGAMSCIVQHDRKKKKVVIRYPKQGAAKDGEQMKTIVGAEALDLPNLGFAPRDFVENMSIVLVSKLTMKDGELVLKERNRMPRKLEESDSDQEGGIGEVDEDLETLRESEVRRVTAAIKETIKQKDSSYERMRRQEEEYQKAAIENARKRKFVKSEDQITPKNYLYKDNGKSLEFDEAKLMRDVKNASKHHYGASREELRYEQDDFEIDEDLPDLDDKEVQAATLKIQKAYKDRKTKTSPPAIPNQESSKKSQPQKAQPHKEEEIEEELPDLNDKDVQKATLAIQKAYKKRNEKSKETPIRPATKEIKVQEKPPQVTNYLPLKKEEVEEEELPDLNDKGVQNATLAIQKAYLKKKQKQNAVNKDQVKQPSPEVPKKPSSKNILIVDNSQGKANQKEEEEEELPDLNDPDVKNATLAIQKAYMRKKAKADDTKKAPGQSVDNKDRLKVQQSQERVPTEPSGSTRSDAPVIFNNKASKKQDPRSNWYKKPQDAAPQKPETEEKQDDELPDLQDKDVQNATLAIQKAYLKKKAKAAAEKEIPKEVPKVNVSEPQKVNPKKAEPQKKEEEEELPDLEDKDVQKATLAIQKAYLKKKAPKPAVPVVKVTEAKKEEKKVEKEEEKEELPDLEDKDVQKATLAIQKAYLKKKAPKPAAPVVKEPEVKKEEKVQKEEEKEELPDLEDKDVQNATLAIQKAYLKKKAKDAQAKKEQPPVEQPKIQIEKPAEEEEELPDLNDPGVQNATLAIQKAYMRKKGAQKPKKVEEQPVIIKPPEPKEEESDLPNLKDPEVQHATMLIQKAYLKKKDNSQKSSKPPPITIKFVDDSPEKAHEKNKISNTPRRDEEASFTDSRVPGITMYKFDKNQLGAQPEGHHKGTAPPKPKAQPPAQTQNRVQDSKAQEEEEEELPNLQDPDVQKATLAIQKAYLKKKNPQNKSEAVKQPEIVVGDDKKFSQQSKSSPESRPAGKHKTLPLSIPNSQELVDKDELPLSKNASSPHRWKSQRSYTGEIPKIVIHLDTDPPLPDPNRPPGDEFGDYPLGNDYVEERVSYTEGDRPRHADEDDEMPDLEDPQVEKAALAIQKAFKRNHKK